MCNPKACMMSLACNKLPVFDVQLKEGIRRNTAFEEKGLAQYSANVGTRCSHGCSYCSSRIMLRAHNSFQNAGVDPMETGYAIIDPDSAARIACDAKRKRNRGCIQFCATVDAWAPEAQALNIGRQCLEAILREPDWTVRILTKNAAVARDFDVCQKYRDRVLVGITMTAPESKEAIIKAIEPNASPITERMIALRKAHELGLRTYMMCCPLLPQIADGAAEMQQLVSFGQEIGAEEIFVESLNDRGNAFQMTRQVLANAGFAAEAQAIAELSVPGAWSRYATALTATAQQAVVNAYGDARKLRVLLYGGDLAPCDRPRIQEPDGCVKWL